MKKAIFLTIFLVILLIGGIGYYLFNKPAKQSADESPAVTVTAVTLNKEFQADETAANQKYLNKVVQVSGVIKEVSTSAQGLPVFLLETNDMFGILCSMSKESEEEAKKLNAGDQVTVKGYCEGGGGMMDVSLGKCLIVK